MRLNAMISIIENSDFYSNLDKIILELWNQIYFQMKAHIHQIMTRNPVVIDENTSCSEIIHLFHKHPFEHLPIVNQAHVLVGIVSKIDVYSKLIDLAKDSTGREYTRLLLEKTPAKDIMSKNPVCLNPESTIDEVLEIIRIGGFHAIPVVSNEQVVGIVSSSDIMNYIVKGS